ncbi:MAG TPA: DUF541 domain-containing protein [Arcobacter sp.]|nr:DUF541 domain-containing protein [Arcobacter sp.]HIP55857.1 DUF541 domain-containing protein [Arcobacter sp.]
MLKKAILTALIPFSLFSYELNFSKEFSKNISPDNLSTRISVNIINKDERFVSDNLESINDYVKSSNGIKFENGSFNLTPRYSYKNKNRKFLGYAGNLSYTIVSINANSMNEFLSELIDVKNSLKEKSLKLSINNTVWKVSDKKYNNSLDTLRLEAINWIGNYSKELNKSCTIKKISINPRKNGYPRNTIMAKSRSTINVTPAKSDKSISINPKFTLECR